MSDKEEEKIEWPEEVDDSNPFDLAQFNKDEDIEEEKKDEPTTED